MAFPGRLYREGSTLKQENVAGNPKYLFVEQFGFTNFLDGRAIQWIDKLAAAGVNGMRVFAFWPFCKGLEEEPFVRTGGTFDLNRFNEPYFEHLKRWVSHANQNGIAVLFELFDSCGIWFQPVSQYNPFYQIVGSNNHEFSDLNNTRLVDIQRRYIQKVIQTVDPSKNRNVIWAIMNEFTGDKQWHYEMSKYVRSLAPQSLIAGSDHGSPASDDPNVDLWFVHKGSYDINSGSSNVSGDIQQLRSVSGVGKILGYSTDGFQSAGKVRENPTDMGRLAREVVGANVQMFGFLDHKAYDDNVAGSIAQLNIETYQAIVAQFQPTPKPTPAAGTTSPTTSPSTSGGATTSQVFYVKDLPSQHPNVIRDKGGKAIMATNITGFLSHGPYVPVAPSKDLVAEFSLYIDNNTADNNKIVTLDAYDQTHNRVLKQMVVRRCQFPKAGEFTVFKMPFWLPKEANMEFRIFYNGSAYVAADKITLSCPGGTAKPGATTAPGKTGPGPSVTPTQDPNLVIFDPLTDNTTKGKAHGGVFTPDGYKMTENPGGYIAYSTDIVKNIRIEFDAQGFVPEEDIGDGKMVLMQMFDCPHEYDCNGEGVWRSQYSLYEIRKRGKWQGQVVDKTDCLHLKCGGKDREALELVTCFPGHALVLGPIEWNPAVKYHFLVTLKDSRTEIFRNDQKIFSADCSHSFTPDGKLNLRLGGTWFGRIGCTNVTYSNVKIFRG